MRRTGAGALFGDVTQQFAFEFVSHFDKRVAEGST